MRVARFLWKNFARPSVSCLDRTICEFIQCLAARIIPNRDFSKVSTNVAWMKRKIKFSRLASEKQSVNKSRVFLNYFCPLCSKFSDQMGSSVELNKTNLTSFDSHFLHFFPFLSISRKFQPNTNNFGQLWTNRVKQREMLCLKKWCSWVSSRYQT